MYLSRIFFPELPIKTNHFRLMAMRRNMVLLLIVGFFVVSFSMPQPLDQINWLSVQEVATKEKVAPRPILIDLYTGWCYWCKVMDKKTYKNAKVIDYINQHFYAVKQDAESRKTVTWQNKQFSYNATRKVNDFSLYVTRGQLSFPTTVIFASPGSEPAAIPGYMKPGDIEPVLKYFGEGNYKNQDFQEFMKTFKSEW